MEKQLLLEGSILFEAEYLFRSQYPIAFGEAVEYIWLNSLGAELISAIMQPLPYIYFVIKPDDVNVSMGFAGNGKIYYDTMMWQHGARDEILFHELFHIYQNNNRPPVKSWDNEIEAYVAQYLYSRSSTDGRVAEIIDWRFEELIRRLVSCMDKTTGEIMPGSRELFDIAYQDAVEYLAYHPSYSFNDGWFKDANRRGFPNIEKLLKHWL